MPLALASDLIILNSLSLSVFFFFVIFFRCKIGRTNIDTSKNGSKKNFNWRHFLKSGHVYCLSAFNELLETFSILGTFALFTCIDFFYLTL